MVRIEKLHSGLQIIVRGRISPTCDLQVVVSRWWNYKLELVVARVILRITSECVKSECAQWW